jgi:hypothetical protein
MLRSCAIPEKHNGRRCTPMNADKTKESEYARICKWFWLMEHCPVYWRGYLDEDTTLDLDLNSGGRRTLDFGVVRIGIFVPSIRLLHAVQALIYGGRSIRAPAVRRLSAWPFPCLPSIRSRIFGR